MSNHYNNYKELRAKGYGASTALALIKEPDLFSLYNAVLYHDGTEFDYKDFEIKILLEEDTAPDFDLLGEFSNTKGKDAIWHNRSGDRNTYRYFNPSNSVAEYQQGFYDAGYSKHNAYLKARAAIQQDYQAMLDIDKVVVIVTASIEGVELGSFILHSVDRDYAEGAIIDHGMVEEAIANAKRTLDKLQAIRLSEARTTFHNKGFSVHYYHDDIPTQDSFLAKAVCEALADRADLYHPIDADAIAIATEEIKAELETNLVGRR